MDDVPRSPRLDTLTPEELEALRARRTGPRSDQPTETERAAIARAGERKGLRPRQIKARLRRQTLQSLARTRKAARSPLPRPPKLSIGVEY
jgi:hypothetical protein